MQQSHKSPVAIVTGANTGLGYETARTLLKAGYRVVLGCRTQLKSDEASASLRNQTSVSVDSVIAEVIDVSALDSVRSFASRFLQSGLPLHVLVNNAGIWGSHSGKAATSRQQSTDGFELIFATNFLGHFLLTELLLPRLQENAPARIIHVSSRQAHLQGSGLNFQDVMGEKSFQAAGAYKQSKLAQIVYSWSLAQRLQHSGVTSNSCEPGFCATELFRNEPGLAAGSRGGKSPAQGASTQIELALSPALELVSGLHFADSKALQLPQSTKRWLTQRDAATLDKLSGSLCHLKN